MDSTDELVGFAQAHDRAIAVAFGDVAERLIQGDFLGIVCFFRGYSTAYHGVLLLFAFSNRTAA